LSLCLLSLVIITSWWNKKIELVSVVAGDHHEVKKKMEQVSFVAGDHHEVVVEEDGASVLLRVVIRKQL